MKALHALVLIGLVTVCGDAAVAQRRAAIRLPESFGSNPVRLEFDGFGGRNRGNFIVDRYAGEFVRIESRLAVMDPGFVSNRGRGEFSLSGPGLETQLRGRCDFRRNVVTMGIVTADVRRFGYACEIVDEDGVPRGQLALVEPKPQGLKARVLARAIRAGDATFNETTVSLQSLHEYERSPLDSPTPIGYLLAVDSMPLAVLDLTDVNPVLILPSPDSPFALESLVVVALGLAVLRDPDTSDLGDD